MRHKLKLADDDTLEYKSSRTRGGRWPTRLHKI